MEVNVEASGAAAEPPAGSRGIGAWVRGAAARVGMVGGGGAAAVSIEQLLHKYTENEVRPHTFSHLLTPS